jgi:hypothetical protein
MRRALRIYASGVPCPFPRAGGGEKMREQPAWGPLSFSYANGVSLPASNFETIWRREVAFLYYNYRGNTGGN